MSLRFRSTLRRGVPVALMALPALAAAASAVSPPVGAAWPHPHSAIARDPALEARVRQLLAHLSLEQKVGQMTQAEIQSITPADVRRHCIGSVLNGGGSWPGTDRHASVDDWLRLAQRYREASLGCGVPLIWGTDAVHGDNNVYGATLFPHNVGLGAADDPALMTEIGVATARAVRATGIDWTFAPTLAVAQDLRWGRSYESYSQDPDRVARLGAAIVRGLQQGLGSGEGVVATAKHFVGDGATDGGQDQGVAMVDAATMARVHAAGHAAAVAAGVQSVMISFNSWNDVAAGRDHGKMHGSREMISGVLKGAMDFDGLVVTDWNGIGQVPGCTPSSCARAINAGIDMVMVPTAWRAFIRHTVTQVRRGVIPRQRIDDAVTRILRVKLRAGLFDHPVAPAAGAGGPEALRAPALARRAVRESLVLLKNRGAALPLRPGARLLVVGAGADSIAMQSGGWSLTWQGNETSNADFPGATSIAAALRAAGAQVRASIDGAGEDPAQYDAVVAVVGETPYAEGDGDLPRPQSLRLTAHHPDALALLDRVAGHGVPVVTVLLSGRPLYVNDLINRSDAFVAAWLPGTEGGGVADLLLRDAAGRAGYDFRGRLPFAWPATPCQSARADPAPPLYPVGAGLDYRTPDDAARLAESSDDHCPASTDTTNAVTTAR
ncbi:MAG: glycoside hydrolase family 3 protein [Burkholderiales bacterium]|nr:glycoside hydrolase family 3 protein [Burkholderiales bacterium]